MAASRRWRDFFIKSKVFANDHPILDPWCLIKVLVSTPLSVTIKTFRVMIFRMCICSSASTGVLAWKGSMDYARWYVPVSISSRRTRKTWQPTTEDPAHLRNTFHDHVFETRAGSVRTCQSVGSPPRRQEDLTGSAKITLHFPLSLRENRSISFNFIPFQGKKSIKKTWYFQDFSAWIDAMRDTLKIL